MIPRSCRMRLARCFQCAAMIDFGNYISHYYLADMNDNKPFEKATAEELKELKQHDWVMCLTAVEPRGLVSTAQITEVLDDGMVRVRTRVGEDTGPVSSRYMERIDPPIGGVAYSETKQAVCKVIAKKEDGWLLATSENEMFVESLPRMAPCNDYPNFPSEGMIMKQTELVMPWMGDKAMEKHRGSTEKLDAGSGPGFLFGTDSGAFTEEALTYHQTDEFRKAFLWHYRRGSGWSWKWKWAWRPSPKVIDCGNGNYGVFLQLGFLSLNVWVEGSSQKSNQTTHE